MEDGLAYQSIIETPAFVFLTRLVTDIPEAVFYLTWVQFTESVAEAEAQEVGEGLAFFWCEAGHVFVSLGVKDVNLLVGYVQITYQHHWLATLLQILEIAPEVQIPFISSELLPLEGSTGVRYIHTNNEKLLVLKSDSSSFLVVLRHSDIKLG